MVKPKKHLGQHFLKDLSTAQQIVDCLSFKSYMHVIEVGPGMGVLTQFLINKAPGKLTLIEVDEESVSYIRKNFNLLHFNLIQDDFLKTNLSDFLLEPSAVIGNFPYNISTQILFRVYEHRNLIPEVVGMFQKEVAERICSLPGKKTYGIQSVLLQSCYDCEYLFTVEPTAFNPPPKVKSGVIKLTYNPLKKIKSKESDFKKVIKTSFNQRRKTLRNALKSILPQDKFADTMPFASKRAEELNWQQFDELALWIFK
jgi:16S rRNA (adenine1518-N6/adenine1519-N6)-dimethyltransferase